MKLSQRVAHDRLQRICFIDYDREMALVAELTDPQTQQPQIIGVGRLSKQHLRPEAEFSMLVSDAFQKQGLGAEFLRRLIQVARDSKLERIGAEILSQNTGMQAVCRKLGFQLSDMPEDGIIRANLELQPESC